jgi:predicted Rossmann fold flavoprotein
MKKDVVIVGAGAAGLMCAAGAGKRGRSVLLLEHAGKPGKKILISGGGRCNFTNVNMEADNFVSGNPHFCKSALARYTPNDIITLVEKHGIEYHEKEKGQLFCVGSSREIVVMLREECDKAGVEIRLNSRIAEITRQHDFTIKTDSGMIESESVVIASGGLSYPNLGATDFGHRIAGQFGLRVVPPAPALVPLTFSAADLKKFGKLAGISFEATVTCGGHQFRGEVLFTHRGLSGPAILQVSSHWDRDREVLINLLPDLDAHELFLARRERRMEMKNLLSHYLPRRFAHEWCELYLPSKPLYQYNDKELLKASRLIREWSIIPAGTEGYSTAEVTRGGVNTDELSSRTMEAKKVRGLYFIGEVVDVTGHLGGYNLQWAWSSGWAAGQFA